MRKVVLDSIEFKTEKTRDWKNSIGKIIPYEYDNLKGTFEILDYDTIKSKLKLLIVEQDKIVEITTAHLQEVKLKAILGILKYDFKYSVGEVIETNFGIIKILNKYKDGNFKYYNCVNMETKIETVLKESYIWDNRVRKTCGGKFCIKGVNDVATTHPHLVKYFANIEDAYTHTYASNKKCLMRCPDCGFEKQMTVNKLSSLGFICSRCNDGVSYPNKFIIGVLSQLAINFKVEMIFDWSNNKRYDIYIPSLSMIIENHGLQHYKGGFEAYGGRTLEEEQENDIYKKNLALNNNIKHYIELDCKKSELEWIKNSVMESELPRLLNFKEEDINWIECEIYARKSLLITVCELWNNKVGSTQDIADKVGLSRQTVAQYLKSGVEIGICNYTKEESRRYGRLKVKPSTEQGKVHEKKVRCLELNMIFDSCTKAKVFLDKKYNDNFNKGHISACARGDRKSHKNLHFEYV